MTRAMTGVVGAVVVVTRVGVCMVIVSIALAVPRLVPQWPWLAGTPRA